MHAFIFSTTLLASMAFAFPSGIQTRDVEAANTEAYTWQVTDFTNSPDGEETDYNFSIYGQPYETTSGAKIPEFNATCSGTTGQGYIPCSVYGPAESQGSGVKSTFQTESGAPLTVKYAYIEGDTVQTTYTAVQDVAFDGSQSYSFTMTPGAPQSEGW